MIDSINMVVENVKSIDIGYLRHTLGINVKDGFDENIKTDNFKYKDVDYTYYQTFHNLFLKTTTSKVLNKKDVTIKDKDAFKENINNSLNDILKTKDLMYDIKITRFDYMVDINVQTANFTTNGDSDNKNVNVNNKMKTYIQLLKKHKFKFRAMRKKKDYNTGLYLETSSGRTINFYWKEKCIIDKGIKKGKKIKKKNKGDIEKMQFQINELNEKVNEELKTYKNIFRLELQNKKGTLKSHYKSSKKANKKDSNVKIQERTIDNYWDKDTMYKYYVKEITAYLYKGDYYKLELAIKKISESDYKESWKIKLSKFICGIHNIGIGKMEDRYSRNTFKGYIERLNTIKVNPITIPDNSKFEMLEGFYSLMMKQINNVYFKQ